MNQYTWIYYYPEKDVQDINFPDEPTLIRLDHEGKIIRERWAKNIDHDDTLLESGPIYSKENGLECPNCGQPNLRAIGESKFECGNCDWYTEY